MHAAPGCQAAAVGEDEDLERDHRVGGRGDHRDEDLELGTLLAHPSNRQWATAAAIAAELVTSPSVEVALSRRRGPRS